MVFSDVQSEKPLQQLRAAGTMAVFGPKFVSGHIIGDPVREKNHVRHSGPKWMCLEKMEKYGIPPSIAVARGKIMINEWILGYTSFRQTRK